MDASRDAKKILIVEDEEDLVRLVSYNLKREGYKVLEAYDGTDVQRTVRAGKPDLVLLDLMLPGVSGLELCRRLKADSSTKSIPIIMLTAKGEELDKVLGLELGADDYITKPFGVNELMARIRAVLRRATPEEPAAENVLSVGDLTITKDACSVTKAGRALTLSATEYRILLYLAERRGRVFSRDRLLDALWGNESHVEPRTVDVHIRKLRSQIEDDPSAPRYLLTKRGLGYLITDEEP